MIRKDKEIINIEEKINIIKQCRVCRLGLSENNQPYVVPLNYGYNFEKNRLTLFFHGAGMRRGNGVSHDLAEWRPSPLPRAQRKQTCYMQLCRTPLFYIIYFFRYLYLYFP
jgi:hypothetical protein